MSKTTHFNASKSTMTCTNMWLVSAPGPHLFLAPKKRTLKRSDGLRIYVFVRECMLRGCRWLTDLLRE
ncbi:hypothetical protein L596_006265 [Steinernema carpocapsae]|uniref:Uncharacterized protein n=1 Tax=Steinernema carpocapsae TaxID=34508 RepID=A0A4U8V7M6_STECR|nr:hypothetical protein L596_006265 [Steinernema carpocapsae]